MTAAPQAAPDRPRSGLRRFTGPRPPAVERCELCSVEVGPGHRHLVDTERRSLACVCPPCAMLFDRPGVGTGRFRTVPDRCLTDPEADFDEGSWAALQIPVGMVFFLHNSALDRVVTFYPSPAGATESEVDPTVWEAVREASPLARALEPDVEALLFRHHEQRTDCYLVPVDRAYELVGRMRRHWHGFDGGAEARAELTAFFDLLARRARSMPAAAPYEREGLA
jgi:hypothetical protein